MSLSVEHNSTTRPEVRVPTETPRLSFRIWTESDLPLAQRLWGDAAVTQRIGGPFSDAQVQARLAQEIANQREYGMQYWPMFSREDNTFTGCCGVRPYDLDAGILELGFHLCKHAWRKGYATEAARTVIYFAFAELGATALFAGHHPENAGSKRVLEKLGFNFVRAELYPPTGLMHPSYMLYPDVGGARDYVPC